MYSNKVSLKISVRRESARSPLSLPYLTPMPQKKKKKRTPRDASERQDRKKQRMWERETNREPQRKQISETMRKGERPHFIYPTAHLASPKSEDLSHPQGPQDLRSNRKSPEADGPNCSFATLGKIPPLPLWNEKNKHIILNEIPRFVFFHG